MLLDGVSVGCQNYCLGRVHGGYLKEGKLNKVCFDE